MNTMKWRDELAHLLVAGGAKLLLGKTMLCFDWEREMGQTGIMQRDDVLWLSSGGSVRTTTR